MKVLFIDNFDSFTYNLVDEFEKRDAEVLVYRNDIELAALLEIVGTQAPQLLVISPGPSIPDRAGVCLSAVEALADSLPIFGVCLGHQVIVQAFGGVITRAPEPVHGKTSLIEHDGRGCFAGLPSPMSVGRYHSLIGTAIPEVMEVSAQRDAIVMALRHKSLPIESVQFHPESILTPEGGQLIANVMRAAGVAAE